MQGRLSYYCVIDINCPSKKREEKKNAKSVTSSRKEEEEKEENEERRRAREERREKREEAFARARGKARASVLVFDFNAAADPI